MLIIKVTKKACVLKVEISSFYSFLNLAIYTSKLLNIKNLATSNFQLLEHLKRIKGAFRQPLYNFIFFINIYLHNLNLHKQL